MATVNVQTETAPGARTAVVTRSQQGRLRLTHPTRGYAVSRNPFTIPAVLPGLVAATILLEIAQLTGTDRVVSIFDRAIDIGVIGYLVLVLGLLFVPAMVLRGSMVLSHDGISFERGKDQITAGWDHIQGILWKRDCGMCLVFSGQEQSSERIRQPGGMVAIRGGETHIPLRWFGDRQYSILYDVRDRLPEASWKEAVQRASNRSTNRCLAVYAGVVVVCSFALGLTAWAYSG